jgi:hypothetical protein
MIKLTGIRTYYYTDKMEHVHFIKHLTRVHAVDGVGNARAIGSPCTLCELLQVGETRALFHCRAVPANALPSVAASGRSCLCREVEATEAREKGGGGRPKRARREEATWRFGQKRERWSSPRERGEGDGQTRRRTRRARRGRSGRPARSPRRRRRPRQCRLRWSSAEAGPPSPSLTEQALSLEPAGLIERRDRGRRVGGGA